MQSAIVILNTYRFLYQKKSFTFIGMISNFKNEFFGIGIQNGKTPENLGVLWRSAQNLGASFIFTIGNRYAKQASDTHNAVKSMPIFITTPLKIFLTICPKEHVL